MNELQTILHILLDKVQTNFTTEAEILQVRAQINELTSLVIQDLVDDAETLVTGKQARRA